MGPLGAMISRPHVGAEAVIRVAASVLKLHRGGEEKAMVAACGHFMAAS